VTTLELATLLHDLRSSRDRHAACGFPGNSPAERTAGCPFQVSNLCSIHEIRPFGCRIFFCDETSADWQQRHYEFFHSELKRLHERLAVPYFCVEWRQALRALEPALSLAQTSL
jgi:Fe-S-cluster containining protein